MRFLHQGRGFGVHPWGKAYRGAFGVPVWKIGVHSVGHDPWGRGASKQPVGTKGWGAPRGSTVGCTQQGRCIGLHTNESVPDPPLNQSTPSLTLSTPGAAGRQGPVAGQEAALAEGVLQLLQLLLLLQRCRLPPPAQLLADILLPAQAVGGLGNLQLQRQVPLQGAQRVLGTEGTLGTPARPAPYPRAMRARGHLHAKGRLCLLHWDGRIAPCTPRSSAPPLGQGAEGSASHRLPLFGTPQR